MFVATDDKISTFNGRFATNATAAKVDWSGATIRFSVYQTSSVLVLLEGNSQWSVRVNGSVTGVISSARANATGIIAARGLCKGSTHVVTLLKMDEALCGAVTFTGVILDEGGKLAPATPVPSRRMAFLGDSITCGYGSLGTAPCPGYSCGASPHAPHNETNWESAYWSYGAVLGRHFEADTQIICVSGAGFAHAWKKNPQDPSKGGMSEKFALVLGSQPNTSSNLIDPGAWIPDAVIINIGTNDMGIPHGNVSAVWVTTYLQFLHRWRAAWPNTTFFLGCFPMLGNPGDNPAIRIVANAFNDDKTHVLEFDSLHASYGKGCYGHPNITGHAMMANMTGNVISKVLGWDGD